MNSILHAVLLLGTAYFAAAGLLFFWGERLLFHPPFPPYKNADVGAFPLALPSGNPVSALFLEVPEAPGVLLYAHGNAEDLSAIRPRVERLAELGLSVLAFDYPGYGPNNDRPSEQGVYAAAEAAWNFLRERRIPSDRIFLMGFSLGSGAAIHLAQGHPAAGIILQGAFTTPFRTVTRIPLFPEDRFRNIDRVPALTVPALFIHGTQDEVVPFHHGQQLFQDYGGPKSHCWVVGGGHNGLWSRFPEQLSEALQQFFRQHLPEDSVFIAPPTKIRPPRRRLEYLRHRKR